MRYIKNTNNYVHIPDNYEQCFIRDNFAPVNRGVLMQIKAKGVIDNDDIKITEFIYRVGFATIEQIERYCDMLGIEEAQNRVSALCKYMVLSDFVFTDIENYKGVYPPDIKMFYCLQEGGRYLLEQFSGLTLIEWEQAYNLRCSRNIGKALILTEFYLDFLSIKSDLTFYTRNPFYVFKKNQLKGGATYGVNTSKGTVYTLVDVIRKSETLDGIREKLRRYESLLSTKIWRHYYPDGIETPTLIIITDTDESALLLAKEIAIMKIPSFLVSTDERILKGIGDVGAFLQYNADEETLYEASYFNFE